KVPYTALSRRAAADDPTTWGTRQQAQQWLQDLPLLRGEGGIGIVLIEIDDRHSLCGVDLDTCRDTDGNITDWAQEIVERFGSYSEISPSKTGLKIFFRLETADVALLRAEIGNLHKKKWSRGGGEHPPAIELHLSHSYYTVTGNSLEGTPG